MNFYQLNGLTPEQLHALIMESPAGFSAEASSIQYLVYRDCPDPVWATPTNLASSSPVGGPAFHIEPSEPVDKK